MGTPGKKAQIIPNLIHSPINLTSSIGDLINSSHAALLIVPLGWQKPVDFSIVSKLPMLIDNNLSNIEKGNFYG